MKKVLSLLCLMALVFSVSTAEAQTLSKKERKALKKEIKQYKKNPEKWVAMMNKHEAEVTALEEEVAELKAELDKLRAQNEALHAKIADLNLKYDNLLASMPTTDLPDGTVYQVQMGYYQQLDLVSFNNKLKVVKAEEVDGAKRYVIGYFEDLMDAWQFASDIKALGIEDAFVTQYIDGVRNMEFDALDAIDQ